MSRVVRECLTVHKESVERLDLRLLELQAFFGEARFVLRELPELGVMELLVDSAFTRPTAEAVLPVRLVGEAVAHVMPYGRFVLC